MVAILFLLVPSSVPTYKACLQWSTLNIDKCDAPGAATKYAIDLNKTLGPKCNATVASESCCYAPLGYSGGPPLGTPCEQVCAHQGLRTGSDDAVGWAIGAGVQPATLVFVG